MEFTEEHFIEPCEDSKTFKVFKKLFSLWLTAMAVITTYGALQYTWWLGVLVCTAWLGALLFLDSFFGDTPRPARPSSS